MARGKILVVRGGAIGDFILTLPVFSALRKQFPGTHLEVLGYPHIATLARAGGLVDEVRSIEARPLAGFFARNGTLSPVLCEYFSGFAIVISFLYDPDGIFQENIARCSKAQFLAGPHRPNENEKRHATEVFLQPLERLAIFDADPVPCLRLKSPAKTKKIALHPGSGSERKNWPEEKWAELISRLLRETSFQILLVGGEAEGNRLQRLSANIPSTRLELAEKLSLVELACRLENCAGFVGHDSGISHLASALQLPGLILWGETIEEIWRPRSDAATLLRSPDGLSKLSAEKVFAELTRLFGH